MIDEAYKNDFLLIMIHGAVAAPDYVYAATPEPVIGDNILFMRQYPNHWCGVIVQKGEEFSEVTDARVRAGLYEIEDWARTTIGNTDVVWVSPKVCS